MKKERSFCRFDKDFRIAGRQEIKKMNVRKLPINRFYV